MRNIFYQERFPPKYYDLITGRTFVVNKFFCGLLFKILFFHLSLFVGFKFDQTKTSASLMKVVSKKVV